MSYENETLTAFKLHGWKFIPHSQTYFCQKCGATIKFGFMGNDSYTMTCGSYCTSKEPYEHRYHCKL